MSNYILIPGKMANTTVKYGGRAVVSGIAYAKGGRNIRWYDN